MSKVWVTDWTIKNICGGYFLVKPKQIGSTLPKLNMLFFFSSSKCDAPPEKRVILDMQHMQNWLIQQNPWNEDVKN